MDERDDGLAFGGRSGGGGGGSRWGTGGGGGGGDEPPKSSGGRKVQIVGRSGGTTRTPGKNRWAAAMEGAGGDN